MKTIFQRQLSFVTAERSDTWIAQATGIPRSTLGFVRRGERPLPAAYAKQVRNVFERESYRRLTATGMSREQARRFQWVAPESSRLKESEMKLLVDKFTSGMVGMKAARLQREGVSFDWDELWKEGKAKIIESLRRSKHPVEDFGEPDY